MHYLGKKESVSQSFENSAFCPDSLPENSAFIVSQHQARIACQRDLTMYMAYVRKLFSTLLSELSSNKTVENHLRTVSCSIMGSFLPSVLPTVWHETSSLPNQATQDPKIFGPVLGDSVSRPRTQRRWRNSDPAHLCTCTMLLRPLAYRPCFFRLPLRAVPLALLLVLLWLRIDTSCCRQTPVLRDVSPP